MPIDIARGNLVPARARIAAFQQIISQKADMGLYSISRDAAARRGRVGQRRKGKKRQKSQKVSTAHERHPLENFCLTCRLRVPRQYRVLDRKSVV